MEGTEVNLKDIERIMKLMEEHGLTEFKLEQDDTKLELKKGGDLNIEAVQRLMASSASFAAPHHAGFHPSTHPAPHAAEPAVKSGGLPAGVKEIKCPLVGTFYCSPSPEAPPYVKVGDRVEENSIVCTIEAMKVFNPITAEIRGEIVEILVKNQTPVAYGDPLFRVKVD